MSRTKSEDSNSPSLTSEPSPEAADAGSSAAKIPNATRQLKDGLWLVLDTQNATVIGEIFVSVSPPVEHWFVKPGHLDKMLPVKLTYQYGNDDKLSVVKSRSNSLGRTYYKCDVSGPFPAGQYP